MRCLSARSLYISLLRLHPPAFRRRFGEEMLCFFDEALGSERTVRLLADGLASLLRQRLARPQQAAHVQVAAHYYEVATSCVTAPRLLLATALALCMLCGFAVLITQSVPSFHRAVSSMHAQAERVHAAIGGRLGPLHQPSAEATLVANENAAAHSMGHAQLATSIRSFLTKLAACFQNSGATPGQTRFASGSQLVAAGCSENAVDDLRVNQLTHGELAPETSHCYLIQLESGDAVAGFVTQHDTAAGIDVFYPDGSLLRSLQATHDGRRELAFVAESRGTYLLRLKAAPQPQTQRYELQLTKRLSLDQRMRPTFQPEKYSSAQIEALRKQIEAGNKSTEEFWRQLEQKHAPLVESTEDDKQHQFVTFLWRGTPNTRNVLVLFYPFAANQTQDYEMRQLADSNVWYLTIRLPSGARFAYQLSPNDPLTFQGPDAFWRDATAQADPLNPHRWQCASDASKFDCQSMVELPGAVQQPWIDLNPSTPAGKVERLTIKSSFLKSERNIAVYTPAGYRAEHKAYALLVVFDEDAYLTLVPTPVILDNLIAASKIEPTVAVLIGEPDLMARLKDLECNREFTDFLGRELTPWMHAHYNVTTDPRETIIGGSSLGGIAATYAALRYPEIFGNVLSQSGAFWWAPDHNPGPDAEASTETGWLAKQFLASPKLPLRFYMDAGVFEGDFRGRGFDILGPTRHMRDVLVAKGYEVHYQQFVGGHDYLNWRGTLADGLLALSSR